MFDFHLLSRGFLFRSPVLNSLLSVPILKGFLLSLKWQKFAGGYVDEFLTKIKYFRMKAGKKDNDNRNDDKGEVIITYGI